MSLITKTTHGGNHALSEGMWQTLLRRKYIGSRALSQVYWKPRDSYFWAGLMSMNKFFFPFGSFSIKDGSEIRFLEDTWLGNTTLREQFPALYSIVRHKNDTLAKVMETFPPNMTFRRDLVGPRLASWNELLQRLALVNLTQGTDDGIYITIINSQWTLCTKH